MIVTRQRKRRRSLGRFIVPALVLAGLAGALAWPPSHHVIADGPLAPVWSAGARGVAVATRPLSFAAQQQVITDKNRTLRELDGRLETQRQAKAAAEARVAQLQHQIDAPPPSPPRPRCPRPSAPPPRPGSASPRRRAAVGRGLQAAGRDLGRDGAREGRRGRRSACPTTRSPACWP